MYIQEITKMEAYFNNQEKESFINTIRILEELINKMESYKCDCIEFTDYDDGDTYCIEALEDVKVRLKNIKEMRFIF